MVIENILQHEILNINKEIIKKRVCIKDLLQDPMIIQGGKEYSVSKDCLESIAENCNLPQSLIFLPITFFIPAGSYEGYITSPEDAEVLESLGYNLPLRGDKYWLPKYKIRKLESKCKGVVQSVIVP